MRKILYTLSTAILLVACGGGATNKTSTTETTTETTTSSETKLSDNPDYTKGLALIAGSDCLTCHKVAEKSIGPAYQDVAAKYENTDDNIEMLAGKIIKGGGIEHPVGGEQQPTRQAQEHVTRGRTHYH